MTLGEWTVRWLFKEPLPREVDPITLTWWMHRRVDTEATPDSRVVVQFDYRDAKPPTIWLVLDRGEPSVCMNHPGFDTDVLVTTDPVSLIRVFSGIDALRVARDAGRVRIEGLPSLVGQFESWFLWSPFAPAVRQRTG